jgi:hypothetical protein
MYEAMGIKFCEISVSHSGNDEKHYIMGCDAV